MKKIKVKFVDFWDTFDCENNFFISLLNQKYDVVISDEPEYLFYSIFSRNFLKYNNCIRIFYTGENIIPDFNLCDYAMGFDWIEFSDRYLRIPLYLLQEGFMQGDYNNLINEAINRGKNSEEECKKKEEFCSYVYSNGRANPIRKEIFDTLNSYKRVNSGGKYMNNVGGPVEDKKMFEEKHKFSIACENSSYPGYTTEKLIQAFAANTVPIYWGDSEVGKVFNTKSFINVNDYFSLDEVLQKIIELDSDDQKYMKMMSEKIFVEEYNLNDEYKNITKFLYNIFDQQLDLAHRRNRGMQGGFYEKFFQRYSKVDMVLKRVKRFIKK